ncbi:preprotein translocase subunit SecG [bacterium BRH_c32]|nr:MAG: preprotein translocase subunit SecG [bacterium BRH_c32]
MYTLLISISILISFVLIVVILLQSSKGGGLAGTFGGSGGGQFGSVFGTRRTADFLSRATWWLGGALLVLALVINLFFLPKSALDGKDSVIQSGKRQSVPAQQQSIPAQKPVK